MGVRETSLGGKDGDFHTTRWSALYRGDVGEIIRIYWKPVYVFLRRKGRSIDDAKELTQDFFTNFLEKEYFERADRSRGRFRDFLRTAARNFASKARARAHAQKRGGGKVFRLETREIERSLSSQDKQELEFDRQWAKAILDDALEALRLEFDEKGQGDRFKEFEPVLAEGTHPERMALHRARKRLRELVVQRVSRTVSRPDQIRGELEILFESL